MGTIWQSWDGGRPAPPMEAPGTQLSRRLAISGQPGTQHLPRAPSWGRQSGAEDSGPTRRPEGSMAMACFRAKLGCRATLRNGGHPEVLSGGGPPPAEAGPSQAGRSRAPASSYGHPLPSPAAESGFRRSRFRQKVTGGCKCIYMKE